MYIYIYMGYFDYGILRAFLYFEFEAITPHGLIM